jgi:AmiR/NasT family two-component response regulator
MQGIIAVEKNLTRFAEMLESEGYEVVELSQANLDDVDAVLVSGSDINLLNMQDTLTEVPVINTSGKTTAEVIAELERL